MSKYRFSFKDASDIAESICGIDEWRAVAVERCIGGFCASGTSSNLEEIEEIDYEKVIVSDSALDDHATKYETGTGKCWECRGSGTQWKLWDCEKGSTYETCDCCKGSGNAELAK